jgi:hypothetical protein
VHPTQEREPKDNSISRFELDERGERGRRGEMPEWCKLCMYIFRGIQKLKQEKVWVVFEFVINNHSDWVSYSESQSG